jgi:Big-like domain-containing protein
VTASPTSANTGANVTFTISVTSGTGTPSGNVTLQIDGGTVYGATGATTVSNQALSGGTLQYTTTFSTAGTHDVVAQYLGDSTHTPSVGVGEVVISSPSSGKGTIGLSATNVTVSQGSTGTSTVTVSPGGGYTGTVDLTFTTSNNSALQNLCYSFTTTQSNGAGTVAVSGTAAVTTQLSLDTNAADCAAVLKGSGNHVFRPLRSVLKASRNDAPKPGARSLPAGIAFAGLLLAGFLARGSRRLRGLACLIALGALGMALTACGSSSTPSTASDPPKGTYTITLTGTDSVTSTITNTTTFSLTID